MTTFLALARLTVGANPQQHKLELQEGMERLVEEMVACGWSDADVERCFEDACAANDVNL